MNYGLLGVMLLSYGVAMAEEPVPVEPPKVEHKPGDVLQVQQDLSLKKVDMTKLYVQSVEWQGPTPSGIEYGLRQDGLVVWRRK